MKLERAIEILEGKANWTEIYHPRDVEEAQKLGAEALKRLKEHREEHIDITFRALPGETLN